MPENTAVSCRKTFFLASTWQFQSFSASDESERRRLRGLFFVIDALDEYLLQCNDRDCVHSSSETCASSFSRGINAKHILACIRLLLEPRRHNSSPDKTPTITWHWEVTRKHRHSSTVTAGQCRSSNGVPIPERRGFHQAQGAYGALRPQMLGLPS